jgi:tetratricopeptide (TPR) repeat protein
MKAYLISGNAFLVLNQFEDAIFNSKKCSDIAKETGDNEHEMKAYLVSGSAFLALNQFEDAIFNGKKCSDIAKETGDKKHEMNAYLVLGEMYLSINQYDAAILNYDKCIDIAKETGDTETELTAHLKIMGPDTIQSLSQYDDILNCKNCIDTTRETGDNRSQVNAFFVDILNKIGDFVSHLNRGMAIAVEVNDNIKKETFEFMLTHIINYLNEIGNSKILKSLLAGSSGDEDDYQTLMENLWEAKTTNCTTRMITLLILSRYHASQHEYEKAIRCVQKVLMDMEPHFLKCYINAHCHEVLAYNYFKLNQFDKVLAQLHLGLPNAKQCCYKLPEFILSYTLGKLYFTLGRNEESKQFLGEAIRCTDSLLEERHNRDDEYMAIKIFDSHTHI